MEITKQHLIDQINSAECHSDLDEVAVIVRDQGDFLLKKDREEIIKLGKKKRTAL